MWAKDGVRHSWSEDYRRVERAILYLVENFRRQPDLGEVARAVGLSEYHFQRVFKRWAGVSPKRFVQSLTLRHAKGLLESRSVLEAAYGAGLSGPGRLHDLFVACEAVTPGEYRRRGRGVEMVCGFHATPFGECLIGLTRRGVCWLSFLEGGRDEALEELRREWPAAVLREDSGLTGPVVERIFGQMGGEPLRLFLRGTNFQIKVWEALLRVPPGGLVSYRELAGSVGRPDAVRAVAGAVARNPVAYIVPCHRVIRSTGAVGGYRWGAVRKRAMIAREAALRAG
ncbi:methylated-DNA--[protein]-cysteine S-methyltransferase [Rubrobacter taiwanensis]|jgi:AraC family transcriptional regulator of adaptative response/methylated-DNA-[protein]-cysteine methyltransferase|uniref:methylated-DNA--[protein]-cysteine S-methyltransferase n=1 Tax=Rubrobacter taiwanensis TaxID=185139 RepID=A0A4R1BFV0_9ACTN|nr:methylated-DNA--[protein]-cysteine S-methyltransferase [Rubrobacter taiwanensis]TCJ16049.1 methylated-DNA--[protein]-cysteine S-methyltransferase [Rubrobacter taiwanensis]